MGAGGADAKSGSSDHHSRARAGLEWERLGVGRATSAGGGTANRSRGSTAAAMGIWVRRWDWEAVSKDGPQQSESRSSRERGERDRWVRRTPKSKSGGCSGGGDWEAVMMAKASRRLLKKKGCRRQRKSRAGRARTGQITVQSRASRESRSSEKPKIDVERGRAKSANRHGQRTVSTRSMRKEVQDQGERKMSRAA